MMTTESKKEDTCGELPVVCCKLNAGVKGFSDRDRVATAVDAWLGGMTNSVPLCGIMAKLAGNSVISHYSQ